MKRLQRSTLTGSVAACFCLALAVPLLAAEPPVTGPAKQPSPTEKTVAATKPAEKCLSDLRVFDKQMEKDGYWLSGSGYGFGYPMGGYGFGYPMGGYPAAAAAATPTASATATGYEDARPGYEVRALVASADILARHGQQVPCENVLTASRAIYKVYVADMHSGKMPMVDMPDWRNSLLAAAEPVTDKNMSIRSDELLGTPVRNPKDVALGSVEDLIMSPQTGKIAYLVIGRGGIFGIDEKYVPIPWNDFKITPNVDLLVLDTTKTALSAAPQVNDDQFTSSGHFDQESNKVDAYWKTQLAGQSSPANGSLAKSSD